MSELLQDGVQVRHPPVVGDLSVADSHGVDRLELDGLTGGCDAEKVTEVGAVVDLVGGDDVEVSPLLLRSRSQFRSLARSYDSF